MKKYLTTLKNHQLSIQVKDDIVKEMEKQQKKKLKNIFQVENAKIVK